MSYKTYGFAVRIIRRCPYFLRRIFWVNLWYYNREKGMDRSIDLQEYISYANDT